MNQAQALKNLMENGTSIEYFNDGYIMKAKDKIKVDFDEDADDEYTRERSGCEAIYSQSEHKFQQTEQLYSDDEENDQIIVEKPVKTPKPTPQNRRRSTQSC
ncbi:MAG: hypothetical protein EZS28_047803 [Streblomastix strix]|uniref:Uncharacterized protein n=1 Tax=Streblomastix strix TaxID=222440 RepID=A0A5J4TG61_9EUKA|nr:MAG: hypothetical protein EZS28_047803 [Streblomastix strix]